MFNFNRKFKKPEINSDLVNRRFKVIEQISTLIIGYSDINILLDEILTLVPSVVGVALTAILLYDDNKKELKLVKTSIPKVVERVVETATGKKIQEIVYPTSDPSNVFSKAITEKRIQVLPEVEKSLIPLMNVIFAKRIVNLTQLQIKLLVVVPLIINQKIIGVVALGWRNKEINEEEIRFLNTFSNQVSTAIYNSQLFSEVNNQVQVLTAKNKELQSLYNLTAKISTSLDPQEVAQFAVDSLPQDDMMLGGALSKYDEDEKTVYVVTTTKNQLAYQVEKIIGEFSQYKLRFNDPNPIVQQNVSLVAIKTGQPQFTNDLSSYMAPVIPKQFMSVISGILSIKSLAVYPITSKGKIVGVITFFLKAKKAEELDENEKRLLATYANQIGIAYENANVYKKLQETQLKLEVSLNQLEEARKHERDMIDIMGHELRTPISIARNALLMMDSQSKKDPTVIQESMAKLLNMAVESTRREVALIETLLTATKAEGKGFQLLLEKVNLLDVVQESLNAFDVEAKKKGLEIVYKPPVEPIFVFADKTRIQEVADNFVSNAVKYTIKGNVEIELTKDANLGYMAVKDSGIGIKEDDLRRLGEKFFRARQYIDDQFASEAESKESSNDKTEVVRPGGTGLGLFVTFNLVKVMDGKLDIKSKVGEGSTFSFGLPLYTNQEPQQVERKVEKD